MKEDLIPQNQQSKSSILHLEDVTNESTLVDPLQRNILASLVKNQTKNNHQFYESYTRGDYPSDTAPDKPDSFTDNFMLAPRPPLPWEQERQRHTYYTRLQRGDWKSDALKESLRHQITLAEALFQVPMAAASIITDQTWISQSCTNNLDFFSTANRDMTFCGHAILRRDRRPLVVLDAARDWRFQAYPQVKNEMIRFYAGVPLISTVHNLTKSKSMESIGSTELNEFPIGTLCIMSSIPRASFTLQEEHLLRNLGDTIMSLVDYHLCNAHVHEQQLRTQCLADFAKLPLQQTTGKETLVVAMNSRYADMNEMMNEACTQIRSCFQDMAECQFVTDDVSFTELQTFCRTNRLEYLTVAVYESLESHEHCSQLHGHLLLYGKDPEQIFNQNDYNFLITFSTAMTVFLQDKVIQRTNRAKTEFLNSMSHEIRTPLHGLSAMTDLLMENEKITPDMMNLLTLMQTSGRALHTVISNIFAFRDLETTQRINRGVLESVNLDQTMQEILDGHASVLKSHLELFFENHLPFHLTHFTVNVEMFQSICNQLIANATKFTDQGYVTVTLRQATTNIDKSPKRMVIECLIKDTGRGLSSEFIKNGLFAPFCKEDPYTQGVGLGLNLCTKYAQALDQTAQVKLLTTKPQGGSTFTLQFDCDLDQPTETDSQLNLGEGYIDEHERWTRLQREIMPVIYLNDDRHCSSPERNQFADLYHAFYELTTQFSISSTRQNTFAVHLIETRNIKPMKPHCKVNATALEREAARLAQRYTEYGGGCVVVITNIANMIKYAALLEKYPNLYIVCAPFGRTRANTILYKAVHDEHQRRKERKVKEIQRLQQRREMQASPDHIEAFRARDIFAMVVDDNGINLNILSTFLKKREVRHITAQDGDEAVDAFLQHKGKINLILMDIQMKRMNGLEAVCLIRKHEKEHPDWQPSKIAMLTGLADTQSKEESRLAGASSYFSKPLKLKDLDAILKDWFGGAQ